MYITDAYSVYVIRQEKQRLAQIITSNMAIYIEQLNAAAEEKKYEAPEGATVVKNIVDLKQNEIRFDGCARVVALPGQKLLAMTEKGPV